ncbi:MAG: hypothetical protein J7M25_04200 [Deltaproteobacteria bacterium]|nr:hypothetical protein [Deltaproteobacteria bacterium]
MSEQKPRLRSRWRRVVGTAAVAGAVALGLAYWTARRRVDLVILVRIPAHPHAQSVTVEVSRKGAAKGQVSLRHLEGVGPTYKQVFHLKKGDYKVRTRIENHDGSTSEMSRSFKLKTHTQLTITIH